MDNSSLQIMEQRVSGMRARLETLRVEERLFQRAAGLRTQQEKDHASVLEMTASLEAEKKTLEDLHAQKAQAMQATATAIARKMEQMLPYGRAVFSVDDDGDVMLGWEIPGHGLVSYGGLSGGQRVLFDGALAHALLRQDRKNPIILVEGAELGQEIDLLLDSVSRANVGTQIIACTCHELDSVSEGWTAVQVKETAQ